MTQLDDIDHMTTFLQQIQSLHVYYTLSYNYNCHIQGGPKKPDLFEC